MAKQPVNGIKKLSDYHMDIGSTGGMGSVSVIIRQVKEDDLDSKIVIKTQVSSLGSTGTTVIETNAEGLRRLAQAFKIAADRATRDEQREVDFADDYVALPK